MMIVVGIKKNQWRQPIFLAKCKQKNHNSEKIFILICIHILTSSDSTVFDTVVSIKVHSILQYMGSSSEL